MKQTTILNMSVLLVLAAAANAQQPDEEKTCSNETLKGSYGGVINGTRPAPSVFLGGSGLQGAGYIQFGLGPDMDSDPVCFDITSGTNSKDYRIVKIDRGEILCNYRVKVVKEIAPSFRHLVLQTIERANSTRE